MPEPERLIDILTPGPVAEPELKNTPSMSEIHIPYKEGVLVLYRLHGDTHLFSGKFIYNKKKRKGWK